MIVSEVTDEARGKTLGLTLVNTIILIKTISIHFFFQLTNSILHERGVREFALLR